MDMVSTQHATVDEIVRKPEGEIATWPAPFEATPPENRLDMPVQSFRRWKGAERRAPAAPSAWRTPWLARLFVFGGAWALTAYGAWEMYNVVSVSRTTFLQYVLLLLFTVNFSWIALAFTSAILGFVTLLFGLLKSPRAETLSQKTVVVMPIYNESTARTFAALAAIRESVEATGLGEHFDYFIVSDTTNPDIWVAEERAFLALRQRLGPEARIYYRHRPKNHHRKAGNIADFVTRWGGHYAHMVVLDADSLMTGTCIVRLAAAMEADPDAGIIQSLPLIINRNTFFARLQQFAARVYGPVIATGLAVWSGRDGNYWGHNAIIRTKAFADHCGLPDLKGKPPFGGHVLSHDFVEAALIRRAGWSVYMLPDLTGSYEESPPSLIDISVRDRRWCQGNLQHIFVLPARGLHWVSRIHLLTGIGSYLASPLWLLLILAGLVLSLQAHFIRPEYFTEDFQLFPTWPVIDAERALRLFGLTMVILFGPKFLGLIAFLRNRDDRRTVGGFRTLASFLFEIIVSALIAPVMMLVHTGAIVSILIGRDSGWKPQRRDDGGVPLRSLIVRHRWHFLMGVALLLAASLDSWVLVAWLSPAILGLLLVVPVSGWTGSNRAGRFIRRIGLLRTPEEVAPPAVAIDAAEIRPAYEAAIAAAPGLATIAGDPQLRAVHLALTDAVAERPRGKIEAVEALAAAKIEDAASISEAVSFMTPQERAMVMATPTLISRLSALPG